MEPRDQYEKLVLFAIFVLLPILLCFWIVTRILDLFNFANIMIVEGGEEINV